MDLHLLMKKCYKKMCYAGFFDSLPDHIFVPFFYRMCTGKKLNLAMPVTFNEKIQWIKLYDRNPLYTQFADKYRVRFYVGEKTGSGILIPLLGKWDDISEIDFDSLPNQFVLKCNHDSGGVVICTDKSAFDVKAAKKKLKRHLAQNYFYMSREWAYKDIKPCIICEKYIIDEENHDLRDYKFFCFNGTPKLIQVDFNRFIDHKRNIYTINWELLDLTIKCPNDPGVIIEKPQNLDEMIEIAGKLSTGIPEVRVDLYSVNGKTYFSELTLYHGGGIEKFSSQKFAKEMGSWIDLSLAHKENSTKLA